MEGGLYELTNFGNLSDGWTLDEAGLDELALSPVSQPQPAQQVQPPPLPQPSEYAQPPQVESLSTTAFPKPMFNRELDWESFPSPSKPSDFAFGDRHNEIINAGVFGCIVWVWNEGSVLEKNVKKVGYICPKLIHLSTAGNIVKKTTSKCCVLIEGEWVSSRIYLSYSSVRCCDDVSNYRCRVLDSTHESWTQIGVFRGDGGLKDLKTPTSTPIKSTARKLHYEDQAEQAEQAELDPNIDRRTIPALWSGNFHLMDKVFGLRTHRSLLSSETITVYVHADDSAKLGKSGLICSRIYHGMSPNISTSKFVVPFNGQWHEAGAYATKTKDVKCCGSLQYTYQVRVRAQFEN